MTKQELWAQIDIAAAEIKKEVTDIEASLPLCLNHYDRYMHILAKSAPLNKDRCKFMVLCLITAGANKEGVMAAYNILHP